MAIPNATKTIHHMGNVIEDIAMSMRAEDFPHIASLLNNLYSDPIAAAVREYSTNAWDSHVTAGLDRPIEVTLPTDERLEFSVQDFGLGLSIDDLREVYSMYGRSLKRETNTVAGMLGLGSKSGLSYAEAFTITAVKGGVKVVAMSTKDEHGVGVIKILDTKGTDEPNGVKITIPVDCYDVDDFHEAASNLFQFWTPGSVLIDGVAPEVPQWRATALSLDEWDHTYLVRQDAGLSRSHVIMGNVAYPVPDAQVGRNTYRFVATLNIGDVDFPPSREEVQFTPHTKATLASLTDYIATTYKRALKGALDSTTTRWEETMLKTLWMDRNVTLRTNQDNPMWLYDQQSYGHAKAKSHFNYRISSLAQPTLFVITGFPSKNVSTQARERLIEFAGPSVKRPVFLILPATLNVGMLDGRPNTHTWHEVLGGTVDPVFAPKQKRAKYETRYAVRGVPGVADMTGAELAEVKGKVLYAEPGENMYYGTLDATIVMLRSCNQIDRIKRFVPQIATYGSEVSKRRKAAEAAITPMDRKIVQARTLPSYYKTLDPTKVLDAELADFIRLAKASDTQTILDANKYGVDVPSAGKNLTEVFDKRYPLLAQVGYYSHRLSDKAIQAEVLFYVNSKAEVLTAPAQAVAS